MLIKDNVTIGIEWRFGPDWPGQRSCMQRNNHPIFIESRPHISRDTAGEVEDAITADKIGVILDHSLAHTS